MSQVTIIRIQETDSETTFEIIEGKSCWIVSLDAAGNGQWVSEVAHYEEFPPADEMRGVELDEERLLEERLRHGDVVEEQELKSITGFTVRRAKAEAQGV